MSVSVSIGIQKIIRASDILAETEEYKNQSRYDSGQFLCYKMFGNNSNYEQEKEWIRINDEFSGPDQRANFTMKQYEWLKKILKNK